MKRMTAVKKADLEDALRSLIGDCRRALAYFSVEQNDLAKQVISNGVFLADKKLPRRLTKNERRQR